MENSSHWKEAAWSPRVHRNQFNTELVGFKIRKIITLRMLLTISQWYAYFLILVCYNEIFITNMLICSLGKVLKTIVKMACIKIWFFECRGTVELTMLQSRLSYHTPLKWTSVTCFYCTLWPVSLGVLQKGIKLKTKYKWGYCTHTRFWNEAPGRRSLFNYRMWLTILVQY